MPSNTFQTFTKNAFFSYSAKILMFGFGFFYTLLVANALGPERYGLVTFFLDFVLGLLTLVGLRLFSDLILVFVSKYKSIKFVKKLLLIEFLLALLVFILVNMFADSIIAFLGKGTRELLFVVSIFVFLQPVYETGIAMMMAFKRFGKNFKRLALEKTLELSIAFSLIVLLPVTYSITVLGGFSLPTGMHAILAAKFFAMITAIIVIVFFVRKFNWSDAKVTGLEVKKYLIGIIPDNFLTSIRDQGMVWLMGVFVSPLQLGYYFIANKMLVYSIGSINNALTEVLIPYNVEKADHPDVIAKYTTINIKFLNIMSVGSAIGLLLFGPIVLQYLFPAYLPAVLLFPLFVVLFFAKNLALTSTIFKAINRTDILAKASLVSAIATITIGWFLIQWFSIQGLLMTEIIASLTKNIILIVWLKKNGIGVGIIPYWSDIKFFIQRAIEFAKRLLKK